MTSQIVDVVLGKQKLLNWASSPLEILWIAFWSMIGVAIIWHERSLIKIMSAIIIALALLFFSCWLFLINGTWLVALAPTLALILSATLTLAYSRN